MSVTRRAAVRTLCGAALLLAGVLVVGTAGLAQAPKGPMAWDQSKSVYNHRVHPPEPPSTINWDERITQLLKEEPGDIIVTAVGDMIFNQQISTLPQPERRGLFRIMQEADVAYGNLEFSMNEHPEAQRPFYNFRASPEFAWEVAAIGINMVSMANNHALDFGPEGIRDCLRALDRAKIVHAGAGLTLAAAHTPGSMNVQARLTRFSILSYLRVLDQQVPESRPDGSVPGDHRSCSGPGRRQGRQGRVGGGPA